MISQFLPEITRLYPLQLTIACSFLTLLACTSHHSTNDPVKVIQLSEITTIKPPSGPGAFGSRLINQGGKLTLSWLEADTEQQSALNGSASRFNWSSWDGNAWSGAETITASPKMFSNAADRPSVVIAGDGTRFAHWLEKTNSAVYGYDVKLARYSEQGQSWQPLGTIWQESTANRHGYDGFVTMLPEQNGVKAFWIDGRLYDEKKGGPIRLLSASIADQIGNETVLDDDICSCCDTAAVQTESGPVVFYRGRTADEIRDIMRIYWTGQQWSKPSPVAADNWQIAACTVDGPQADTNGKLIAVVWFSGASGQGAVQIAFSTDHGHTFSHGYVVDSVPAQGPVGQADVILMDNGDALVSWIGRSASSEKNIILLRRFAQDGTAGPYLQVAEVSNSRRLGVPQLEQFADNLYLAWTEPKSPEQMKNANHVHDKISGLKIVKISKRAIPEL